MNVRTLTPRWWGTIVAVGAMVTALIGPLGLAVPSAQAVTVESGTYLGAYVQASGWSTEVQKAAFSGLENDLGRTLDIDHYYYNWNHVFPEWRQRWDAEEGRTPLISWNRTDLSTVVDGSQDALIRQRASGLRDLGTRVLLRWFYEMDDYLGQEIDSPAQFVEAWRRLYDIFQSQGATNVEWVWCPNAYAFGNGLAQQFYPGDAYVDWICADGYNWAPVRPNSPWRSFRDTFASFYAWAAPKAQPLMIGETGVLENNPGDKAAWITDMSTTIKTAYPDVKALVYFDAAASANSFGGWYDWRVDTSVSSYDAFKALAADPYFGGGLPPAPDTVPPSVPTGLRAVASTSSSVDLTWTASSDDVGVQGYEVVRNGGPIASVASASYADSSVSAGTTYTYGVRSYDAAGNVSAASPPVSVSVAALEPVSFADGFEGGSLSAWTSSSQAWTRTGDAHAGSWSAEVQSTSTRRGYATRNLTTASTELYARAWFKVLSQSTTMGLLRLQSPTGGNILTVFVSSSGELMLRNDVRGTNVWSPTRVAPGVWHQVQVRVKVAGASGLTEVWLDGQRIGQLSVTQNLGTVAVGRLMIGDNVARHVHRVLFDDIAVSPGPIA